MLEQEGHKLETNTDNSDGSMFSFLKRTIQILLVLFDEITTLLPQITQKNGLNNNTKFVVLQRLLHSV